MSDGYISDAHGLTVGDLRQLLSEAQPGEPIELAKMSDGTSKPVVAAILSDEQPTRVYLYTEII